MANEQEPPPGVIDALKDPRFSGLDNLGKSDKEQESPSQVLPIQQKRSEVLRKTKKWIGRNAVNISLVSAAVGAVVGAGGLAYQKVIWMKEDSQFEDSLYSHGLPPYVFEQAKETVDGINSLIERGTKSADEIAGIVNQPDNKKAFDRFQEGTALREVVLFKHKNEQAKRNQTMWGGVIWGAISLVGAWFITDKEVRKGKEMGWR